MRIIAAILGIMAAMLLMTGTVSALEIYGNADADVDVNADAQANADSEVESSADAQAQANADAQARSDEDVSVFARIAAFFTGGADNESRYGLNSTNATNNTYNGTYFNQTNESEGGFWASVKAFLKIG